MSGPIGISNIRVKLPFTVSRNLSPECIDTMARLAFRDAVVQSETLEANRDSSSGVAGFCVDSSEDAAWYADRDSEKIARINAAYDALPWDCKEHWRSVVFLWYSRIASACGADVKMIRVSDGNPLQ